MDTPTPYEILEIIKTRIPHSQENYEAFKAALYQDLFKKIPVIVNKIPKGHYLFRTVPVSRMDISVGRQKYISYRPESIDYPFFNRCSEPQQSHFYCSTDRMLSIVECSYFISAGEDPDVKFTKESEMLEVGVWEVTRDLYVADLRFGTFAHADSEDHLTELKARYGQFAKEQYVVDFFDFINLSFETPINKANHLKYWLTACYSNFLFDDQFTPQPGWGNLTEIESKKMMPIDGIFYHSVKGLQTDPPLSGYNMVLRSELVEQEDLKLIKAAIFQTKQFDDKTFVLDDQVKHNTNITARSWNYTDAKEVPLK